jgi:hypothetical protein
MFQSSLFPRVRRTTASVVLIAALVMVAASVLPARAAEDPTEFCRKKFYQGLALACAVSVVNLASFNDYFLPSLAGYAWCIRYLT